MTGVTALRQAVQTYQQAHYGPPVAMEAQRLAHSMVRDAGLNGTSAERYWFLFAICALLNQEPFCRFWKKRKTTRKEIKHKINARAKAVADAIKRREEK